MPLGIGVDTIRLFQEENTNRIICKHLVREETFPEEVGVLPIGEILNVHESLGGYTLDVNKIEKLNRVIKFISDVTGKRNQILVCSGCIRLLNPDS